MTNVHGYDLHSIPIVFHYSVGFDIAYPRMEAMRRPKGRDKQDCLYPRSFRCFKRKKNTMALIKCPECGRMVSPNALECPNCGAPVKDLLASGFSATSVDPPQPTKIPQEHHSNVEVTSELHDTGSVKPTASVQKKSKVMLWALVAVIVIAIATIAIILLYDDTGSPTKRHNKTTFNKQEIETTSNNNNQSSNDRLNSSQTYSDDASTDNSIQYSDAFPDNDRIRKLLGDYSHAVVNNDFSTLEELYAPTVERYHSAYGKSRDYVVDDHRNYDDFFKVYGKHSSLRWETFRTERISDGRVEAVIVEDYSLDRMDESKYSIFVLEKHFIINDDYQIVGVWDNQLSKQKKQVNTY